MSHTDLVLAGFFLLASPHVVLSIPTIEQPTCQVWAPVPEQNGTFFRCVEGR